MSHFIIPTITSALRSFTYNRPTIPQGHQQASTLVLTDKVVLRFWECQTIVTSPLGLIFSVALIWRLIGWPCLLGVVTIIIAQVINGVLTRALLRWESTRRIATDAKLQKITQYVAAIRHLRYYGWHTIWQQTISKARQRELNLRLITGSLGVMLSFFNNLASGMFPVVAFWAYVSVAGKPLRVDVAFPALQLFSMLESSLREVPRLITVLLNAKVAVSRIEDFMGEPDKDDSNRGRVESTSGPVQDSSSSNVRWLNDKLTLEKASFAWPGSSCPVLRNVSIVCPKGITLVYGRVGGGKTALLQAMLGELDLQDGQCLRGHGAIAYCSQTPWLQSMSIRDNILFFSPFDNARYRQVLEACALAPDLSTFRSGDLSDIGENGIGLSGGQKMRVALARAVYSHAGTLLLDDPLSALDQQTAETVVQRCFAGPLLKDRTVVLITHRVDLCRSIAKQIVVVSSGTAQVLAPEATALKDSDQTSSSYPADIHETTEGKDQGLVVAPEKFLEEEHRAHGGVKAAVYWEYIKAGRMRWWVVLIFILAVYRLLAVAEVYFLKKWGEAYSDRTSRRSNTTTPPVSVRKAAFNEIFETLPSPEANIKPWLYGFIILAVAQAVMFLVSQSFMLVIIYSAGRQMFQAILGSISNAAFRFYDITPVGRLMNRMTSDISTVDGNISQQIQDVAWLGITWISSMVIIASVTPVFLAFSFALTVAFVWVFLRFLPTSQSLRRLEVSGYKPRPWLRQ